MIFKNVLRTAALVLAGTLLSPVAATAQDTASGGYKIAVVDLQQVVAEYNKRELRYKELESQVKARQAPIDQLSETIEAKKKQYEDGRTTMSEDDRRDLKFEIEQKFVEYKAMLEKQQNEIDSMEATVLEEVFADIEKTLNKIATRDNYHLILNARGGPRGTVLYHSTQIDITSQVLADLNGS